MRVTLILTGWLDALKNSNDGLQRFKKKKYFEGLFFFILFFKFNRLKVIGNLNDEIIYIIQLIKVVGSR